MENELGNEKPSLAWSFWIRFVALFGVWTGPRLPFTSWLPDRRDVNDWLHDHVLGPVHLDALNRLIPDHALGASVEFVILGTVMWLLIDRHRRNERLMRDVCFTIARLGFAASLSIWGLWKVFPMQLGSPGPFQLMNTLDLNAGPAWSLMWFNGSLTAGSQVFLGVIETSIALLLFFPRTALLGAVTLMLAMIGLFLMESDILGFFKEYPESSNLLAIPWAAGGAMLLSFYIRPVFDFFVRNVPVHLPPIPRARWRLYLELGAAAIALIHNVQRLEYWPRNGRIAALEGIYEVDQFLKNGGPVSGDDVLKRWRLVGVADAGGGDGWKIGNQCYGLIVRTVADSEKTYWPPYEQKGPIKACMDVASGTQGVMHFGARPGSLPDSVQADVSYTRLSPNDLQLETTIDGAHISARIHRLSYESMQLMRR